jgi:hypothetical protein
MLLKQYLMEDFLDGEIINGNRGNIKLKLDQSEH